jgi:hypothetical protein
VAWFSATVPFASVGEPLTTVEQGGRPPVVTATVLLRSFTVSPVRTRLGQTPMARRMSESKARSDSNRRMKTRGRAPKPTR